MIDASDFPLNPNPRNQHGRILAAALRMHDLGFSVVPLLGDAKKAAIKWKRMQTERLARKELLEFLVHFRGNYGVLTGGLSGVVAVEADDPEAVRVLDDRFPPSPMRQRSRKGEHRLYRHPGVHVGNRVGCGVGGRPFAMDVRGDGGYIVGPCCVHRTGHVYSEVEPWTASALERLPLFDPAWFDDAEAKRRAPAGTPPDTTEGHVPADARARRADRWLRTGWDGDPVPGTRQGEKASDKCLWIACRLVHGFDLTPEEALPLLAGWGRRDDQLDVDGDWWPWSGDELRHKLEDADAKEDCEGRPRGYAIRMMPTAAEMDRLKGSIYGRRTA
jgi:hypothetical protein